MSESFDIELGSPLPLSLTLPDGRSGSFPLARVYDSADAEVGGSPFDLTEVGTTGRYTLAAFTPVTAEVFTAHYVVFRDAAHTTEDQSYEQDQDSFVVKAPPSPTGETRPFLGVAFVSGTLQIQVHGERASIRIVPTSLVLTWRNPDGTTLFSLTEATPGVTLEPEDDAYLFTSVQALTTGFVYKVEVTLTDATGSIGPKLFTVAKQ